MNVEEMEELNRYAVKKFDAWGDNEDIEFLFESEDFECWLESSETIKGKKRKILSRRIIIERIKRYFSAMQSLSEENVKLYKQGLTDSDYAPAFINSIVSAIKTYIRFLSEKYNKPELVNFKASSIQIQPKQFIDNVISRADYDFLVSETYKDKKHPNVYLGIKIMGTTGVRRSELMQIKIEHIKYGYLDVIGKGGKQRRIYFPKNAVDETVTW